MDPSLPVSVRLNLRRQGDDALDAFHDAFAEFVLSIDQFFQTGIRFDRFFSQPYAERREADEAAT